MAILVVFWMCVCFDEWFRCLPDLSRPLVGLQSSPVLPTGLEKESK